MILFTQRLDQEIEYTGKELRPHYILEKTRQYGSGIIAFEGPCFVKTEALVDWEDRLSHDHIKAKKMIHFIGEFFQADLIDIVLVQRLMVSIAADALRARVGHRFTIARDGDDIFVSAAAGEPKKKLSVSIVTSSAVSQVLHLGINIDAEGAPVAAIGLNDLGVNSKEFSKEFTDQVLKTTHAELQSVSLACTKVRAVV